MKKIISCIALTFLMMVSVDLYAVPFGRAKLACKLRHPSNCRDPETFKLDLKDGCVYSNGECRKNYCRANCTNSTTCNTDDCNRYCKGVYLGGGSLQDRLLACAPSAAKNLGEETEAIFERKRERQMEKVVRGQRRQAGQYQVAEFNQQLKVYTTKMKEFNHAAAGYREGLRLIRKYEDSYKNLKTETTQLREDLEANFGSRDRVMHDRIKEVTDAYSMTTTYTEDKDLDKSRLRNPRKLKNLTGEAFRGTRDTFRKGYDKDTKWDASSAPASEDGTSIL